VEPQKALPHPAPHAALLTNPSSAARHRHAMRLLRDEHEEIVLVYELSGISESAPRTLVLEWCGGNAIERFDTYPSNWRDLKASALLSLRRTPV
jgi:hypothetical protein